MELIGRSSSHYTRLVRVFAHETGVEYRFTPVLDLMSRERGTFADNPTMRVPVLAVDGEHYFGSRNICRVLHRHAQREIAVFWPEDAAGALLMNAHEIMASAMAGEVEVVIHELVAKRPPDDASHKRRAGLANCLAWLDAELDAVRSAMPARELSVFEAELYCLLTHFAFRNPMDLSALPRLTAFEREFGARESARATPYRFDA